MTDDEVLQKLLPLIGEVTGVPDDQIRWDSVLMSDMGAESLDLLDLSFLVEERFGILLEADAIERQATQRMGDVPYEQDGVLTEAGLTELRRALPELDGPRLVHPFRKTEIPSLLTVGVFVRLIQRKLQAAEVEVANA